ncbi:MAG TPA: hypothetical protein VLZ07_09065 [Syntrophales bacterium]|nr:hypothetical protein [Syntrophales bacterium]
MQQQLKNGVRKRSETTVLGLPLVDIAFGADPDKGENRGHTRGLIAAGDIATGWIAVGGIAKGGGAIGITAVGGFAVGYYAAGGAAFGKYVLSALERNREAIEFFSKWYPFLSFK